MRRTLLTLTSLTSLALVITVWGIQRDLPILTEADENDFADRAAAMAASGQLDPGWFGKPGSTLMYPLTGATRLWHASQNSRTHAHKTTTAPEVYLLGRLLSALYAALTVPLVYLLGKQVFSKSVGLLGAWLFILSPTAVAHSQMVRTDSAAAFFATLTLVLYTSKPSRTRWLTAGVTTGLAIATRYLMACLVVVLVATQLTNTRRNVKAAAYDLTIGLIGVIVGFAASTPYFFLRFQTAWENIRFEARQYHAGADGFSAAGNLWWYLTHAVPNAITWPMALLAAAGLVLVVSRQKPKQLVLVGYVAAFLIIISILPLHWERWIIPILSTLALLEAVALNTITRLRPRLLPVLVVAVSIWPLHDLVLLNTAGSRPSTRLQARTWIMENLPHDSPIIVEKYTLTLDEDWRVQDTGPLPSIGKPFDLAAAGFRYIVINKSLYLDHYQKEPLRYAHKLAYYEELETTTAHLLKTFKPKAVCRHEPTTFCGGPELAIYELVSSP